MDITEQKNMLQPNITWLIVKLLLIKLNELNLFHPKIYYQGQQPADECWARLCLYTFTFDVNAGIIICIWKHPVLLTSSPHDEPPAVYMQYVSM
jgi:hypothetical protein